VTTDGDPAANSEKPPAGKHAAVATLLCLLGFVGFWAAATVLYPGGTWSDRTRVGESFFGNFFCDLTQPISLSGVANPVGSRLAQCGMLLFAGALFGLFWVVPWHFASGSRAQPWVRGLGAASVLAFVAVPLAPSQRYGHLHAVLALVSGGLGIPAALAAVTVLWASGRRARALGALGALALACAAFDALIFIRHFGESAPPLLVPAAQKIAALLVSTWIAAVALLVVLDKGSVRA